MSKVTTGMLDRSQAHGKEPLGQYGYAPMSFYHSPAKFILSRYDYATAEAAGFDMSQFAIAPSRYMRC